jgi:UTP--glucose-1-phosphate uridylyltransferase
VEEAIACGLELVVIIVNAQSKSAIESYFDRSFELEHMLEQKGETKLLAEIRRLSNLVNIRYILQKEPLGLGHAVLTAKNAVGNEPFILLLPDDIFELRELLLKQMLEVYNRYQGSVIAVKRVAKEEVNRYGIVDCRKVAERIYQVTDLVEKPHPREAPSNLAIMGRYVLIPAIFKALEETPPGKNQEIQLTDALKRLLPQHPIYAYEFEGERYDAGTPLGWLETTIALALKHPDMGPELRRYLEGLLNNKISQ